MKIVMSYSAVDYNLCFSALALLLEKTEFPVEQLYAHGSQFAPDLPEALVRKGVNYIKCMSDSSKYPLGPNMMFAGIMKYAQDKGWDEPMFLCEPDGFPTCADWYERIRAAHDETGAMVSGSWVGWVKPKHYNGNMVIHPKLLTAAPWLGRVCHDPWDCFHAELLAKFGHENKEIYNPRRVIKNYPTRWWLGLNVGGHVPAWIHGCQTFQVWEHIEREGFANAKAEE